MTATIEPDTYAGTLEHLDPNVLMLRRNIRDAQPSKELVASVKALGVLEPITVVRDTTAGEIVVRFGHRRTLAAVEAGLASVPVYILGDDDTADAAEVGRIIAQRDENTHRTGLTAGEEVGAIAQLAAFGLSANQIVKQARVGRAKVDTALVVSGSALAAAAIDRYADLTLEQAAVVAEFEHDAEVAKELILCAIERPSNFPHVAQRRRDEARKEVRKEEGRAWCEAQGITLVERPSYEDATTTLVRLVDAETGEDVTAEGHAACDGHVAWLDTVWVYLDADGVEVDQNSPEWAEKEAAYEAAYEAIDDDDDEARDALVAPSDGLTNTQVYRPAFGCTNPKGHGHKDRYGNSQGGTNGGKIAAADMTEEQRAAASAQRRVVIENNKAWASAEVVRREWLAAFGKRKTAPKGAAAFIAQSLVSTNDLQGLLDYQGDLSLEWLGIEDKAKGKAVSEASDQRVLHIALVKVLARYERSCDAAAWRQDGKSSSTGRYLRYLEACGYGLSDVEKYAVSSKTA